MLTIPELLGKGVVFMKRVSINCYNHFFELTNQKREVVNVQGSTLFDMAEQLNNKYPGFKKVLCEDKGTLRRRNQIILDRINEKPVVIENINHELKDGDIYTIW